MKSDFSVATHHETGPIPTVIISGETFVPMKAFEMLLRKYCAFSGIDPEDVVDEIKEDYQK